MIPTLDYPGIITETPEYLRQIARQLPHEDSKKKTRILLALKTGKADSQRTVASVTGCTRSQSFNWWKWWKLYKKGGLQRLLPELFVHPPGGVWVNKERWEEIKDRVKPMAVGALREIMNFDKEIEEASGQSAARKNGVGVRRNQ